MWRSCLFLLLVYCPPALTCSNALVFELMAQRLALMPSVAHYKFVRQLPVEDRAREALVLDSAGEAAQVAGLSAASIMPLMRAQITVAKGIQQRIIDHLQTGGAHAPATPTPDLLTAVRPRLLTLAAEQLAALRCRIQGAGVFSGAGHRQLDSALADLKLTASERAALWNGLLEVRLRSVD
jgi:chorismate mutase-like protein